MLSSKKKIDELEKRTATLETCVHVLNSQIIDLQSMIQKLSESVEEKEENLTAQADEIRRWNEGITNIMNYSLEVARGDKR